MAALVLLVGLAPGAAANTPIREEQHRTYLGCNWFESGGLWVYFGAIAYDDGTGWASLSVWNGTSWLTVDQNQPVSATGDATSLQASISLVDEGGAAGTAILSATMAPVGSPITYDSTRIGNLTTRVSGQDQPLGLVAGTLTIGSVMITLAPSMCSGNRIDLTFFSTQPNATVSSDEGADGTCSASDGAGHGALLNFYAWQGWYVGVGFTLFEGDEPIATGGDAGQMIDGHASIPVAGLSGPFDGHYIQGSSGLVELSFARTGVQYGYTVTSSTGTLRWTGELLDVGGTLTVDGGQEFGSLQLELTECTGFEWTAKAIYTNPQGPKPGGQVPTNDLPSGAITLKPGSKTVIATKGASPDFEVGFECDSWPDENGDPIYLNIGYTVWYKIAGTGRPITVDTTGSDFDTTVGVFTADASGGWTPLPGGCVEDVPLQPVGVSWQAVVTVPTAIGTWYYVEIGGYPGVNPYGTLKITVR